MRGMFSPATSVRRRKETVGLAEERLGKVRYAAAPRLSPRSVATGARVPRQPLGVAQCCTSPTPAIHYMPGEISVEVLTKCRAEHLLRGKDRCVAAGA
jgi:hypothetical protein